MANDKHQAPGTGPAPGKVQHPAPGPRHDPAPQATLRKVHLAERICFAVVVFAIVTLALVVSACAPAPVQAQPSPKDPVLAEPRTLRPGPKTRTAEQERIGDPNDPLAPIDFVLDPEEISPPPGCLELRRRGGNC